HGAQEMSPIEIKEASGSNPIIYELAMKRVKQTKLPAIFIFILLLMFSCSKINKVEDSSIIGQENFVELSLAKEIAGEIYFENKINPTIVNKSSSTKPTRRTLETINEVTNERGKTSFYVVNYSEGGFVILSADKRTQPILASSENGEFVIDENSYPPGLKLWMEGAKKQIADIQDANIEQSEANKFAWKEVQNALVTSSQNLKASGLIVTRVEPLLSTIWKQLGGFNDELDYITCNGNSFQIYAGCVPIAMAQVMKFHEYPTNYNWSAMPESSGTTTTASLIRDIHDAIGNVYPGDPYYNCYGTWTSTAEMDVVLENEFGYSSSAQTKRDGAGFDELIEDLNNGMPVILAGFSRNGGHMWVCDGYMKSHNKNYNTTFWGLHMNWGWGGTHNGYYRPQNLDPNDNGGFYDIVVVHGIKP
ncbi:MAG: hypothetical protein GY834_16260, partial [Bacteroidetes bacterium]|nr:hypothetical protein [Bacteroidota bacterium]